MKKLPKNFGKMKGEKKKEKEKSWQAEAIWNVRTDTISVIDWDMRTIEREIYKMVLAQVGGKDIKIVRVKITIV